MILPVGASSFSEAMRMGSEVYHHLKKVIQAQYGQDATNVGDEGGFAPNIGSAREGLELIKTAIERAGYTGKVKIAMDVAASEFYVKDSATTGGPGYDLQFKVANNDGKGVITAEQLADEYLALASEYDIVSIEDPFDQVRALSSKTKRTYRASAYLLCDGYCSFTQGKFAPFESIMLYIA